MIVDVGYIRLAKACVVDRIKARTRNLLFSLHSLHIEMKSFVLVPWWFVQKKNCCVLRGMEQRLFVNKA